MLDLKTYPKQHEFITCPKRYAAFIGGIGTGKTQGLVIKAILKTQENPGSRGVITAPTYPMLRDATKNTFFDICPRELVAYRNDSENLVGLYTSSGQISEIMFRSTSDPDSLRGPNLVWAGMDEGAISTVDAYQILIGRLRAGDPKAQQLFLASTPRGFNWIYDKFGPHVDDPEYASFYAQTKDNIFLPEEYIKSIYANYSGAFAQQELDGKFTAYEGLIYGDLFDYDMHVGNFPYIPDLTVDLAWDFGYPNAEAVLAIQQDAVGNVFVIDEAYRMRTLTEDIVADIRGRPWAKGIVDGVGDEARPDNIRRVNELGLPLRASSKGKIVDGIKLVRELLGTDKETKKARLHIDKRCEMLIREFGLYRWADKRQQTDDYVERPVDQWNHALDAFRYWVKSKWFAPAYIPVLGEKPKPVKRVMAYQQMYS